MSGLKWVFDEGMKSTLNMPTTGNQREIQSRLNPNEIHLFGGGFNALVDVIICAFKEIISSS